MYPEKSQAIKRQAVAMFESSLKKSRWTVKTLPSSALRSRLEEAMASAEFASGSESRIKAKNTEKRFKPNSQARYANPSIPSGRVSPHSAFRAGPSLVC
jgi:hypothetical protein